MGRAIVREPQVFLMDEPLSNLDAKLRTQMRAEIAGLQRELGVTTIYVTHDQVEAMTMGTRIAVMRDGCLQQQGPPQELYDEPANLFVATLHRLAGDEPAPGTNRAGRRRACVRARRRAAAARRGNAAATRSRPTRAPRSRSGSAPSTSASPAASPAGRPRLRGRVRFVELLGAERHVQIELDARPVVADELLELARDTDETAASEILRESARGQAARDGALRRARKVEAGDRVEVSVPAERLRFFDLGSGNAIRG